MSGLTDFRDYCRQQAKADPEGAALWTQLADEIDEWVETGLGQAPDLFGNMSPEPQHDTG